MYKKITTERHQKALEYALNQIKNSPIKEFIHSIWLYGSCARNEQKYNSDVDILIVVNATQKEFFDIKKDIIFLKGNVSTLNASDPEVDLKIILNETFLFDTSLFLNNIRKDGLLIWKR